MTTIRTRLLAAWSEHRRRIAADRQTAAALAEADELERLRHRGLPDPTDAQLSRLLHDVIAEGGPVVSDRERVYWASAMDAAAAGRADAADPTAHLAPPRLGVAWDREYLRSVGVTL